MFNLYLASSAENCFKSLQWCSLSSVFEAEVDHFSLKVFFGVSGNFMGWFHTMNCPHHGSSDESSLCFINYFHLLWLEGFRFLCFSSRSFETDWWECEQVAKSSDTDTSQATVTAVVVVCMVVYWSPFWESQHFHSLFCFLGCWPWVCLCCMLMWFQMQLSETFWEKRSIQLPLIISGTLLFETTHWKCGCVFPEPSVILQSSSCPSRLVIFLPFFFYPL